MNWRGLVRGGVALVLVVSGLFVEVESVSAEALTSLTVTRVTSTPVLSGDVVEYSLGFACAAIDEFECADLVIVIPLEAEITQAYVQSHPYVQSAVFTEGVGMTITFLPSIPAGAAGAMTMILATGVGTTPDGYSWPVDATLSGSNVATVSSSSDGEVTATPQVEVFKTLPGDLPADSLMPLDTTMRYYLEVCTPGVSLVGNLYLEVSSLVDTLPAGAVFEAASLTGGVQGVEVAGTVTWDGLSDMGSSHCGDVQPAPKFWVEVHYPTPTFTTASTVTNNAELTGTPYGDPTPYTDTSSIDHGFGAATVGGPGLKYASDYAYAGSGEINYDIRASNTGNIAAQIDMYDPLPCLDNNLGTTALPEYHSLTASEVCVNPAVELLRIYLSGQLYTAVLAGYRPEVITNLGNVYTLEFDGNRNLYVPTLLAGEMVATVHLQYLFLPTASERQMHIYVQAVANDPTGLMPVDAELHNTVTIDYSYNSTVMVTVQATASTVIVGGPDLRPFKAVEREIINGEARLVWTLSTHNLSPFPISDLIMTDLLQDGAVVDYVRMSADQPPGTIEIIDDYDGSGRQLVRWTQRPGTEIAADGWITFSLVMAAPTWAAMPSPYTDNWVFAGFSGTPPQGALAFCYNASGVKNWFPTGTGGGGGGFNRGLTITDTYDMDGDGIIVDDLACRAQRRIVRTDSFELLETEKLVQGDVDLAAGRDFAGFPTVGEVTPGGTASYQIELRNNGSDVLENFVLYDILPFVGDSGVSELPLATSRDSEWAPTLSGPVIAPAGATVEYSSSTDPCRPEVSISNTTPPDCDDNWTTVFLGGPGDEVAFRITWPGPLAPRTTETISVSVDVPAGVSAGEVAWNSYAVAADTASGAPLPVTEPPKVGLSVPLSDVSLTKAVDPAFVLVGETVEYTLVISHDGVVVVDPVTGAATYLGAVSVARGVVVTDVIPAGVTLVSGSSAVTRDQGGLPGSFNEGTSVWTIGDLDIGERETLKYSATVDLAGTHVNTAEVTAMITADVDSTPSNCDTVVEDDCASATVTTGVPSIVLEKSAETFAGSGVFIPADGADGDSDGDDADSPYATGIAEAATPVTYEFTVTNDGALPLTDVTISDPMIEAYCTTFDIGALAVGQSVSVQCTWPFGWGFGTTTNTASVTGNYVGQTATITVDDSDSADVVAVFNFDFGDAPDTYGTTLAESGPRHNLAGGEILLGASVDRDADGQPSPSADLDGDDEDGVDFGSATVEPGSLEVPVVVTNTSGGAVSLCGWIDFDKGTSFGDGSAEESCVTVPASGDNADCDETVVTGVFDCVLSWSPPGTTIFTGSTFARFRVGTSASAVGSPTGRAADGEIEDYPIDLSTLPVTVASFSSSVTSGGVDVVWWSGTESANVGYVVYGEDADASLVGLTDLVAGAGDSLNPLEYSVLVDAGFDVLWLADVDVRGVETLHGPYRVGETVGKVPETKQIDWAKSRRQAATAADAGEKRRGQTQNKLITADNTVDDGVAGVLLVLGVEEAGLVRVGYNDVLAAGVDWSGIKTKMLAVIDAAGMPVAVRVGGPARFGPDSYVEFWGDSVDTLYTGVNKYRLVLDETLAVEIGSDLAKVPKSSVSAAQSFAHTEVFEEQHSYSLIAPGDDPWYWKSILSFGTPHSNTTEINLDDVAPGAASISVGVWGGLDFPVANDHHVSVTVNDVPAGEVVFDGIIDTVIVGSLPDGVLVDGSNTVTVTVHGDTGASFDRVNVDQITVTYPRTITAVDDTITFNADTKRNTVTGFSTPNIEIIRHDTDGVTRIVKHDAVMQSDGLFTISFAGTGADAMYTVTADTAVTVPTISVGRVPVGLLDGTANLLIITHSVFADHLEPLIAARTAQGLAVKVVEVEDLYAAYTGNVVDPAAISRYISDAATTFGDPSILLVGADSYDYHDYTGVGSVAYIPSIYGDVGIGDIRWSPIDPAYTDLDGDQVPDLPLGRFPVRDLEELDNIINKTLAYTPSPSAMFTAETGYKHNADNIASALPDDYTVTTAYPDDTDTATARNTLIDTINSGTSLTVYFGHSSTTQWAPEALLTTADTSLLTNTTNPTTIIQFGCWNTYFSDPTQQSLGTSLLTSPAGAATVLGATTLTNAYHDTLFGPHLIEAITTNTTIGQALTAAKHQLKTHTTAPDITLGWTLLGDPTTPITPQL